MALGMGVMRLGIALGFFQGVVVVIRRQKPCILTSGNMLVDRLMHMGAPAIESRAPEGAHEH
jgi:ribose/xylose/arabinose/galactoside ABC-type transport system permease subunit